MAVLLGIDGGGSHTRALAFDTVTHRIGRGEAGPANMHSVGLRAAVDNIVLSTQSALAHLGTDGAITLCCLGLAGCGREEDRRALADALARAGLPVCTGDILTDAHIAWMGAFLGGPGAIVVSGTGSVAYGVDHAGRSHRAGGYGSRYSDEGSAYDIGRQAVSACLQHVDGRLAGGILLAAVMGELCLSQTAQLVELAAHDKLTRPQVASLSDTVSCLADAGDEIAGQILAQAAESLSRLAAAVLNCLAVSGGARPRVALLGGALRGSRRLYLLTSQLIQQEYPSCRIERPALSPLGGALLIAMIRSGIAPEEDIISMLVSL